MCLCRYLSNLNWRFARGEVTDTPIIMPSPSRISLGARLAGLAGRQKSRCTLLGGMNMCQGIPFKLRGNASFQFHVPLTSKLGHIRKRFHSRRRRQEEQPNNETQAGPNRSDHRPFCGRVFCVRPSRCRVCRSSPGGRCCLRQRRRAHADAGIGCSAFVCRHGHVPPNGQRPPAVQSHGGDAQRRRCVHL